MAVESLEELLGDLAPRIEDLQTQVDPEEHGGTDDGETEELALFWLDELFKRTRDSLRVCKALFHPKVRRVLSNDLLGPTFAIGTRDVPFLDAATEKLLEPSAEAQLILDLLLYDRERCSSLEEAWRGQELRFVVRALARHLVPRIGGPNSHAGAICRAMLRELDQGESKSLQRLYDEHPLLLTFAEELVEAARVFDACSNRPDPDLFIREIQERVGALEEERRRRREFQKRINALQKEMQIKLDPKIS